MKKRLVDFICKLMSVKLIIFGIASWFLYVGKLPWWAWLLCASALMGIRYFEKVAGLGVQK